MVASRTRAHARESEGTVKQILFEFAAKDVAGFSTPLDPRIEEELIARMAEAILSIIEARGGRNDEQPRTQS